MPFHPAVAGYPGLHFCLDVVKPDVEVVLGELRERGVDSPLGPVRRDVIHTEGQLRPVADGLDVEVLGRGGRSPRVWWRLRRLSRHSSVVVAYGSTTLPATALALLGSRVPWVYRSIGDPAHWAGGRLRRSRMHSDCRAASRPRTIAGWPDPRFPIGQDRARSHLLPNNRKHRKSMLRFIRPAPVSSGGIVKAMFVPQVSCRRSRAEPPSCRREPGRRSLRISTPRSDWWRRCWR